MSEIDLEIQGLKETQSDMERIIRDMRGEPFLNGMRVATLLVQRSAKIKAPVDTGRLRASITPEVRWQGNKAVGIVGSNVIYAPFVELGTRQNLGRFTRSNDGADGGFFVSANAQPFLQPAFDENKETIVRIIGDAVGEIIAGGND